jgi:hypothetical protein
VVSRATQQRVESSSPEAFSECPVSLPLGHPQPVVRFIV